MTQASDDKKNKEKGLSKWIGLAFIVSRDAVAGGLLALGFGPTSVTMAGLCFTAAAAVFLALGAGAGPSVWRFWAVLALLFCGAADMLDGAMARLGNKATTFGAFLDSIVDRYCDILLFLGKEKKTNSIRNYP